MKIGISLSSVGILLLLGTLGFVEIALSEPPPVEYSTLQRISVEDDQERIIAKAAKTLPRPKQVAWQRLEQTYFIHFGVNTFTGRNWGKGNEDPNIFNPSRFDAEQWVTAIDQAGGKMVVITVKHHDGFCLWPSRYTTHDVASSSWLNGHGDVLRAVANACRARGIKLGIYLSPADLHQIHDIDDESEKYYGNGSPTKVSTIPTDPASFKTDPSKGRKPPAGFESYSYAVDDYNRYFLNQLYELCTEYGPITEMWFDGANPKKGYDQVYNRADWYELIHKLQPDALIAIDGPGVRWVGNESGVARETEWSVLPFSAHPLSGEGQPNPRAKDLGSRAKLFDAEYLWWYPAEVDTPLLHGWFWNESLPVKSVPSLLKIYYSSVGRNANLLLNLSPDNRGLIPEEQLESLRPFGQIIRNTFAVDLADGADVVVPDDSLAGGDLLRDGDLDTFWEADASKNTAQIILKLPRETTFDVIALQEPIAQRGQRIEGFTIETWNSDGWQKQATGSTVGHKRLMRLGKPVRSKRVRIKITACRLNPSLAEISLHKEAVAIAAPVIGKRDSAGKVAIANSDGLPIRYSLKGAPPTASSPRYEEPLDMRLGGSIKAASFGDDALPGIIATQTFPSIAPIGWTVDADSAAAPATNAVDDDTSTYWQSDSSPMPHWLTIDAGKRIRVSGFTYAPPPAGGSGTVKHYRFETSLDGSEWTVRAEDEFDNIANNPVRRQVAFDPVSARYMRFTALKEIDGRPFTKAAEIGLIHSR